MHVLSVELVSPVQVVGMVWPRKVLFHFGIGHTWGKNLKSKLQISGL